MKIFITGVNGFVGSALAVHLHKSGMNVAGCSRKDTPPAKLADIIAGYHKCYLNQPFSQDMFKGMDAVIHCAYSAEQRDIFNTNLNGTRQWYEAAKAAGAGTQLFFSSCSARENARTSYGIIKYELEQFFLQKREPVIKPGLIMGEGGLFLKMTNLIKALPVVPLVDRGKHPVPVISLDSVTRATEMVLNHPRPISYHLYQQEFISIKSIMKTIRRVLKRRCLFIPFPSVILKTFARLLDQLKLPLPVSTDSLLGLKEFRYLKPQSSLKTLGIPDPDPETIIKNILNR